MEKIGTNMIEFVVLFQFRSIRAKWCHSECYVSYLRFKVSFLPAFVVSLMPICHVPTKSNKCRSLTLWKTFLNAHSHRAKAKILFGVVVYSLIYLVRSLLFFAFAAAFASCE